MLFEGLTSVPKSRDSAVEYYRQMIKNRTEIEIREFTDVYADKVVKKHLEITDGKLNELTDKQQTRIIDESLVETSKEFLKKWAV